MSKPMKIALAALAAAALAFAVIRISRPDGQPEKGRTGGEQVASAASALDVLRDAKAEPAKVRVAEPKPVVVPDATPKIKIYPPAIDFSRPTVRQYDPRQRYVEFQKVDKIEAKTTAFLMVAADEPLFFWISHSSHDSGEQVTSLHIIHRVAGITPSARLLRDPLAQASQTTVKYRQGDRSVSIPCTSVKSDPQYGGGGTEETLDVSASPDEILDISDAGAFRVSGYSDADMNLDQDDVAAIRWFVWSKVPGGEKLMRERYEIVEAAR